MTKETNHGDQPIETQREKMKKNAHEEEENNHRDQPKEMRRKKRKNMKNAYEEEQEKDALINDLPDDILSLIVSFLPINVAVSTSILSKRWRNVWIGIPSINFDLPKKTDEDFTKKLQETIDHVFTKLPGNIDSCRIKHSEKNILKRDVHRWIEHLTSKRSIKKLSLKCILNDKRKGTEEQHQLPPCTFSSLHELKLEKYKFWNSLPFKSCTNLTTLELFSVDLSDAILEGIILSCELLQNLTLVGCCGLSNLQILDRNLRLLVIGISGVPSITIHDTSLRTLDIQYGFSSCIDYDINTPNLHELRIGSAQIEILELCNHLRVSPDNYVTQFHNLQRLFLNLNLKDIRQAPILAYLLRTNRYLGELVIQINDVYVCTSTQDCLPSNISSYWSKIEQCDSVVHRLTTAKLKGFKGSALEIGFATYLLSNATKLKSITIQCCNGCEFSKLSDLLSLPKAYLDASIIIK